MIIMSIELFGLENIPIIDGSSDISKIIKEVGIDCYRQDFNFSPLSYWRKNDDFDRRGITEIKHINGMYQRKKRMCSIPLP